MSATPKAPLCTLPVTSALKGGTHCHLLLEIYRIMHYVSAASAFLSVSLQCVRDGQYHQNAKIGCGWLNSLAKIIMLGRFGI